MYYCATRREYSFFVFVLKVLYHWRKFVNVEMSALPLKDERNIEGHSDQKMYPLFKLLTQSSGKGKELLILPSSKMAVVENTIPSTTWE